MADFLPYLDLMAEQRDEVHRWLRDHRVNPGRVPVYAQFEYDPAVQEWRIPLYWHNAEGRMRIDQTGVRRIVVRRRELRPLPWPRMADEVLCEDCGELDCGGCLDNVTGMGCPCGGDCWDDEPDRAVETVTALSEAGLL